MICERSYLNQTDLYDMFDQVSLEMSTNMSEPHADLDVTVRADPDSVVNILAVDQSVLLLKTGNDVTPDEVSIL